MAPVGLLELLLVTLALEQAEPVQVSLLHVLMPA
jgi:hypothetical protein